MSDERSAASILYGAPPVTAPPASAPAATTPVEMSSDDAAAILFGGTASVVSTYGPGLSDASNHLRDATGMTTAVHDAHIAEISHVFADAKISSEQAVPLYSLFVSHILKPADPETQQQWETETRERLRGKYGDNADARMRAAHEFVKARPALREQLEATGLGSHPDVLMALTERADILRAPRKR